MSYPPTCSYDVSGGIITSDGLKPVKRAFATGDTVATHTLVSAVAGKKIRVLAAIVTTVDGLNLTFKSGSTDISANFAAAGAVFPYNPHGWFETGAGETLGFAIDAAESTSVQITYVETA